MRRTKNRWLLGIAMTLSAGGGTVVGLTFEAETERYGTVASADVTDPASIVGGQGVSADALCDLCWSAARHFLYLPPWQRTVGSVVCGIVCTVNLGTA